MSDLRWSDCDEMAYRGKFLEALLCRTGKLNDFAHETEGRLDRIENRVHWWGILTATAGLAGIALQIVKSIHG